MYKVLIVNRKTQESRTRIIEDMDWTESDMWWWTEGNYGCDCNRALQFARAIGEDEEWAWDQKCNVFDNQFIVPWVELPSGEKIMIDEDITEEEVNKYVQMDIDTRKKCNQYRLLE